MTLPPPASLLRTCYFSGNTFGRAFSAILAILGPEQSCGREQNCRTEPTFSPAHHTVVRFQYRLFTAARGLTLKAGLAPPACLEE
jgi:hypothetical protein